MAILIKFFKLILAQMHFNVRHTFGNRPATLSIHSYYKVCPITFVFDQYCRHPRRPSEQTLTRKMIKNSGPQLCLSSASAGMANNSNFTQKLSLPLCLKQWRQLWQAQSLVGLDREILE